MKDRIKALQEDIVLHLTLLMLLIAYVSGHKILTITLAVYNVFQFLGALRAELKVADIGNEERNTNQTDANEQQTDQ